MRSHIINKELLLIIKTRLKKRLNLKIQLFLGYLLALLALVGQLYFCLMFKTSVLGLIIGLAISKIKLFGREVVVNFFKYFL